MAIARFPSVVLDCPDPAVLAEFYGRLLDWKVQLDGDWAEVRADYGQAICFQQVADYRPPVWPGQEVPQQSHLDFVVDDLDAARSTMVAKRIEVSEIGDHGGTRSFAFSDPEGRWFAVAG